MREPSIRWGIGVVFVSAVLFAPGHIFADDSEGVSARQAYKEARSKVRNGEYDAAVAMIRQGLETSPKDRKLLQLLGSVLLEKHDYEGALEAYQAFLDANPRGANRRKARKIVADLQIVRTTFLRIEVPNGPAKVYLDYKSYGVICEADPECKIGIVPGRHRVYIEREGFEPVRERFTIEANRTHELRKALVEKPSQLTIEVSPSDAQVALDGNPLGTGRQSLEVAAGEHELVVSLAGFAAHEETLSAHEGKPVASSVSLIEVVGVTSNVPDAKLTLDSQPVALEAGAIPMPPSDDAGRRAHTLIATAEGYEDARVEIPADRPREFSVDVKLEKIPEPEAEPVVVEEKPPVWSTRKKVALATTGGVAALSYGLAIGLGLHARGQWKDVERECLDDGGPGLVCQDDDARNGAQTSAERANLSFAVGTAAAVGLLWVWNWEEAAPAEEGMSLRRKLSIGASAGIAAVGLGVGVGYGLRARSRRDDSKEFCDDDQICSRPGFIAATEALEDADVSDLGFAVAGIAAASAAILWFTAPSAESGSEQALRIEPVLSDEGAGVTLRARF